METVIEEYVMLHRKVERIIDDWWEGHVPMNVALSEIKEVLDLFRPSNED